jgi:hypothetical protein
LAAATEGKEGHTVKEEEEEEEEEEEGGGGVPAVLEAHPWRYVLEYTSDQSHGTNPPSPPS